MSHFLTVYMCRDALPITFETGTSKVVLPNRSSNIG